MTFYEFILKMAVAHPVQLFNLMVTVVIVTIIVLQFVGGLITGICVNLPNRWIRHRNIKAAGWPPSGLDADGDPAPMPPPMSAPLPPLMAPPAPKEEPKEGEEADEQLAT